MREAFLLEVKRQVDYWSKTAAGKKDALEGLASGILSLLDFGNGTQLPAFLVMPATGDGEKLLMMERGENYYPDHCDIAGSLKTDYIKLKR